MQATQVGVATVAAGIALQYLSVVHAATHLATVTEQPAEDN